MAGSLYLGSQKVCPVIVTKISEAPKIMFKLADDITSVSEGSSRGFYSLFHNKDDFAFDVDLNNLEVVSGYSSFDHFMSFCYNSKVKAKNLRVLSGRNAMYSAFYAYNFSIEADVDLSKLEEISGDYGFSEALVGCLLTNPIVRFESLSDLTGNYALVGCLSETNVSEIYFNSLTSQSFGSYTNQIDGIVSWVSGCTIHFPSNLSNIVPTLDGYPNFGGTNTVILYDLPATE